MKLYDVVIYEIGTGEIAEIIGTSLTEEKAEKRQLTGESRINHCFATAVVLAGLYKKGDILPE